MIEALSIASFALALLAIVEGFLLYKLGIRKPSVRFSTNHEVLLDLGGESNDVRRTLRLENQDIDRISRTIVAFWSTGRATIRSDSFVSANPLRLDLPLGALLIQKQVVSCSATDNGVRLIPLQTDHEPLSVLLTWDYLDLEEGAIVEILHTGANPIVRRGKLQGVNFKVAKNLELNTDRIAKRRHAGLLRRSLSSVSSYRSLGWAGLTFGLFLVVLGVASSISLAVTDQKVTVSPSQYDLASIEGQTEFVRAVNRSYPNPSDARMSVLLGLFLTVAGYICLQRSRKIPPSIFREGPGRVTNEPSPGSEEADVP